MTTWSATSQEVSRKCLGMSRRCPLTTWWVTSQRGGAEASSSRRRTGATSSRRSAARSGGGVLTGASPGAAFSWACGARARSSGGCSRCCRGTTSSCAPTRAPSSPASPADTASTVHGQCDQPTHSFRGWLIRLLLPDNARPVAPFCGDGEPVPRRLFMSELAISTR